VRARLFLAIPPHLTTDRLARLPARRRARGGRRGPRPTASTASCCSRARARSATTFTRCRASARSSACSRGRRPDVASLRAGFFLENFLASVPTLAADGAVYMTLPPDRRHGMVAARDIGDVAAALLADDRWRGHLVRGVHGAADLSPAEAVQAFGRALGRTVRYVQVPDAAMRDALLGAGASAHVADEYPRLMAGLGTLDYRAEPRTAETTTPTTVDAWAREVLAPAVAAAGAAGTPAGAR
jgi:hypothetical protein